MVVTFFGHRDAPTSIKPALKDTIINLIKNNGKISFLVGNNGAFDSMVIQALLEIKQQFPHIDFAVVLAYMPQSKKLLSAYAENTIYPEELAFVPKRYAIIKRNFWLINNADTVITFAKSKVGKASYFKNVAEKKGKKIINLNAN